MVVGGYPSEVFGKTEIYDLSGQNLSCPNVTDFPIGYGSVGTFINDKAMICGGTITTPSDTYTSDCYSYDRVK